MAAGGGPVDGTLKKAHRVAVHRAYFPRAYLTHHFSSQMISNFILSFAHIFRLRGRLNEPLDSCVHDQQQPRRSPPNSA